MHGVSLAAAKYAGDVLIVFLTAGRWWTPLDYLSSVHTLVSAPLADAPPALLPSLALWTLPFVWVGLTLTIRRAIDAGRSPWIAMAFFVPYVNYLLMGALAAAPSRPWVARPPGPLVVSGAHFRSTLLLAIGAGLSLGFVMLELSVEVLHDYGAGLLFGTPFVMGAVIGWILGRRVQAGHGLTVVVTIGTIILTGAVLIAIGNEGGGCLIMALPLAAVAGLLGASAGLAMARNAGGDPRGAALGLLMLPIAIAADPTAARGRPIHEVMSVVEINAPPDRVWSDVVAFPPMTDPADGVFRFGIAYPQFARIDGTGVGAVRYCVFSTGAFVEPITAWEPARRLAFDVTSSPPPMREWSPYAGIHPPHLDGYLRSLRGEFRLTALPQGRTRLEGRTWYQVRMAPEGYWQLWSDALIHRIHARVLDHIKQEAERR